jgi:mycoredoxin
MQESPGSVRRPRKTDSSDRTADPITIYSTPWCPDCWRVKYFLKERRVAFHEVNIEENPNAEQIVLSANFGKRRVPTLKVGDRYFACSPFDALQLAEELQIPLNK